MAGPKQDAANRQPTTLEQLLQLSKAQLVWAVMVDERPGVEDRLQRMMQLGFLGIHDVVNLKGFEEITKWAESRAFWAQFIPKPEVEEMEDPPVG